MDTQPRASPAIPERNAVSLPIHRAPGRRAAKIPSCPRSPPRSQRSGSATSTVRPIPSPNSRPPSLGPTAIWATTFTSLKTPSGRGTRPARSAAKTSTANPCGASRLPSKTALTSLSSLPPAVQPSIATTLASPPPTAQSPLACAPPEPSSPVRRIFINSPSASPVKIRTLATAYSRSTPVDSPVARPAAPRPAYRRAPPSPQSPLILEVPSAPQPPSAASPAIAPRLP